VDARFKSFAQISSTRRISLREAYTRPDDFCHRRGSQCDPIGAGQLSCISRFFQRNSSKFFRPCQCFEIRELLPRSMNLCRDLRTQFTMSAHVSVA
jgi:hypothetical protein